MRKLIVGNWKANPQAQRKAKEIFTKIAKEIGRIKRAEVVICPPFVYLHLLRNLQRQLKSSIKLGAQDVFISGGAFTGEISPQMLRDYGCKYVIVGHSERRRMGEDNKLIREKVKAVIKAGMRVILCVGENMDERKKGLTYQVIKKQVVEGLKGISAQAFSNINIAYEPVWAIGTGNFCDPDEAVKVIERIRKFLKRSLRIKKGEEVQILYGGSVNSKNASLYLQKKEIGGLLVGGSSLKPKEFVKIINLA